MRRQFFLLFCLILLYADVSFSKPPLFSYHVKTLIASESDFAVEHELLTQFWQMLQEDHKLAVRFEHTERRNVAIYLQDIVERTLAKHASEYAYARGFILTPKPSSALSLANPQAQLQSLGLPDRTLSVVTRQRDLKQLLASGIPLYSIYAKGGLKKRSLLDQRYYHQLIKTYANLINVELPVSVLSQQYSGAIYLFKDIDDQMYAFIIHASQVDITPDEQTWHIWFGEITQPDVQARLKNVFTYLQKNNQEPRLAKAIQYVFDCMTHCAQSQASRSIKDN